MFALPFFGDKPFWGRRVHALGVGPKPIEYKRMTVEPLAEAIDEAVSNTTMRQTSQELGERIRAEDGVARAVEAITDRSRSAPIEEKRVVALLQHLPYGSNQSGIRERVLCSKGGHH